MRKEHFDEIKIHVVNGGRSLDHQILKGCYFYASVDDPKKYNFYSKFDTLLASDIENGKGFAFSLGPFNWVVLTDFEKANGRWANTDETDEIPHIYQGEGEGTFQVQTGGHGVESVSYASA
jgi:hypothetical protein